MGNLGDYQRMTTLAKRLGGPKALALTVLGLGYVLFRPAEAGVKKVARASRERRAAYRLIGAVFMVTSDGDDNKGLRLRVGGAFRVLEGDGDAILVEVLDGKDNPHMTSGKFLASVSDFPTN